MMTKETNISGVTKRSRKILMKNEEDKDQEREEGKKEDWEKGTEGKKCGVCMC